MRSVKSWLPALTALALSTLPAMAQSDIPDTDIPQPQQVGEITYITGGIGDDERAAIESARSDYNLTIMSAKNSGHFEGDTILTIRDRNGEELLSTEAGPLFYAHLPKGRYTVEASSEGQTRRQQVTIASGKPAHIHFGWKD